MFPFQSFDTYEITGVVCPSHRILTAGWNQVIRTYMDTKGEDEDDTVVQWRHVHRDDITTLAFCPPSTVVSGWHRLCFFFKLTFFFKISTLWCVNHE